MKKVIVITNYSFSNRAGASYARIDCYRKALEGTFSFILCEFGQKFGQINIFNFLSPKNKNVTNFEKKHYLYRNFLCIFDFITPYRIIKYIKDNYSPKEVTILLYGSQLFLSFYAIFLLKRQNNYKVIVEKCELETGKILNMQIPNDMLSAVLFFVLWPIKLFNALIIDFLDFFGSKTITISSKLYDLYSIFNEAKVVKIPILVDTKLFFVGDAISVPIVKFIYSGTFTKKKDSLFLILKAIALLKEKIRGKAEFHFVGSGNRRILAQINQYIIDEGIGDLVIVIPPINHEEMPLLLGMYDFALLIRENNVQTRFGFSTKLGEYLASGLPVIATDISDNCRYLCNKYNSFILDTIDSLSISNIFLNIIENMMNYKPMKGNARLSAEKYFDYYNYTSNLTQLFL